MPGDWFREQFGLSDRVAIVTGGSGVLGGAIARGLAHAGAWVVVIGRREKQVETSAAAISETGGSAIGLVADVLDRAQLESVRDTVLERWGRIDILINAAGGNLPGATLPPGGSLFDLKIDALREVVDLNLFGT
ncbi:MAG: SDR family NAD(P)-dependent oxidoreductase, partial [Thermomicrobiales bacterium]